MDELLPVAIGVLIGGILFMRMLGRAGFAALAVLGLCGAVAATWISGEWRETWLFVLVDAAQIAGAAVLTYAVISTRFWFRSHRRGSSAKL